MDVLLQAQCMRKRVLTVLGCLLFCGQATGNQYRIETLTEGLQNPWSLAFLHDGRMLVTERPGRLQLLGSDGARVAQVDGLPELFASGQSGLMEVKLDPQYPEQPWLYLSYAHGDAQANNTRLARARLEGQRLLDVQVLFTARPLKAGTAHYGGRIAFLPDHTLLLTLGDGFDYREQAQRLDNHLGKIVRLARDGSVPADNPFVGRADVRPEIYSYGHRNVQGIVYDPGQGRIYSHEHGPRGGDELNLIEPGGNYGWPLTTFGVDYTGAVISPYTELPGITSPLLHWTPSVAPASLTQYHGELFPLLKGDLLAATLAERSVRRIRLNKGRLAGEEVLFEELGERIRAVEVSPDGALYLLTDSPEGRLLRVVPAD